MDFFTQTAAASSLERKLAVGIDPHSQIAGEWNSPNSMGVSWGSGEPKIPRSCTPL